MVYNAKSLTFQSGRPKPNTCANSVDPESSHKDLHFAILLLSLDRNFCLHQHQRTSPLQKLRYERVKRSITYYIVLVPNQFKWWALESATDSRIFMIFWWYFFSWQPPKLPIPSRKPERPIDSVALHQACRIFYCLEFFSSMNPLLHKIKCSFAFSHCMHHLRYTLFSLNKMTSIVVWFLLSERGSSAHMFAHAQAVQMFVKPCIRFHKMFGLRFAPSRKHAYIILTPLNPTFI